MKIITDSTADLSAESYEKHDIGVVPLTLRLGDRTWRDLFDIDPDAYYALLRESKDFPATSQPSPEDFIDAFAPFVEKGEPILSIQISSKLSGTYQSANLARSHFPEARIEVVDSLQASLGLGIIILLCAEKASKGAPFEEVADFARDLADRVQTYFAVDSLEYLHRGGRIGKAQTFLGTLMKIKPLLKMTEGEIQPIEKIRTSVKLLNRFAELVENAANDETRLRLSVAESDNSDVMTGLLERLLRVPGVSLVHRCKLGG
ncbi:MAG TPA: DegV family protein, partial [Syntrophorhabdales bacterium]|nr:DegV family protein [Syntrophorhabdales bacterium]